MQLLGIDVMCLWIVRWMFSSSKGVLGSSFKGIVDTSINEAIRAINGAILIQCSHHVSYRQPVLIMCD